MTERPSQFPLVFGHSVSLADRDFTVAASNRDAVAWIGRWPKWPARGLVVHGPAGSGKSHLVAVWQRRSRAWLLDAGSLAAASSVETLERGVAVALDQADGIADPVAETSLLHLHNRIIEAEGWLLLTGRAPSRWPMRLPDLTSRLRALPSVALVPPDDTLLAAVLVKLFADRQLSVPEPVVQLLLSRMERTFAGATRVVAALDTKSLIEKREINRQLAREVLDQIEVEAK